jgi:hypothetical protein
MEIPDERPGGRRGPGGQRRRVRGIPVALREARPMSLDLLAGLGAALAFIYLLWTLLRPEDF